VILATTLVIVVSMVKMINAQHVIMILEFSMKEYVI
jgi:hypothetical protein